MWVAQNWELIILQRCFISVTTIFDGRKRRTGYRTELSYLLEF